MKAAIRSLPLKGISAPELITEMQEIKTARDKAHAELPETWFRKLSHTASGLFGKEDDSKHTMGAAIYGITSGIENRGNVHELVLDVLDNMYSP